MVNFFDASVALGFIETGLAQKANYPNLKDWTMKRHLLIMPLLLFITASASAITVVQCTDAKGHTYFSNNCPEGMTKVGEKKLPGKKKKKGPDIDKISQEHPITFFAIPECDACDLVRNYLNRRGFPFTELDASNDVKIQARLKEIAGSLTVPVVTIDDDVLKGYSKPALDTSLEKAGYPHSAEAAELPRGTPQAGPGTPPKAAPGENP